MGGFEEGIAATLGLALRDDHGSQYVSAAFQQEIAFLGMESSPAFVYAPKGNGVIERFFRRSRSNSCRVHHCTTLAELTQYRPAAMAGALQGAPAGRTSRPSVSEPGPKGP